MSRRVPFHSFISETIIGGQGGSLPTTILSGTGTPGGAPGGEISDVDADNELRRPDQPAPTPRESLDNVKGYVIHFPSTTRTAEDI